MIVDRDASTYMLSVGNAYAAKWEFDILISFTIILIVLIIYMIYESDQAW